MKPILPILCWLLSTIAFSQAKDSEREKVSLRVPATQMPRAEIFTSGFVDILNNGQVNASARFIRLFIGEQGKFFIPLSMYSGVSANNFQNQSLPAVGPRNNDHLVNGYINPLSGLVNLSADGILFLKRTEKVTKTGLLYHFGERVLTGYKTGLTSNLQNGKPINFLNSFATLGLYFQTGAWDRSDTRNTGIFWSVLRFHICYTNPSQIRAFLPDIHTNGIYTGYSLGFGIEINNLVNIKAVYYKYIRQPEPDYSLPIYQFSFNYSLR